MCKATTQRLEVLDRDTCIVKIGKKMLMTFIYKGSKPGSTIHIATPRGFKMSHK